MVNIKYQLAKRIDDVKIEMLEGFEINSNASMETKFNEKLSDAVAALTR